MARRISTPLPGSGWQRWGHALGYSAKRGEYRSDCSPEINPETGFLEWHAVVWKGGDRTTLFESWGAPREAGDAAMAFMGGRA